MERPEATDEIASCPNQQGDLFDAGMRAFEQYAIGF
jgi:hypothetical protein